MTYQLYKMKLNVAHFGTRIIEQSMPTIPVERLFSALFLEALKLGREKEFLKRALEPDFVLSDTMFYRFGLFLPKPIGYPIIDVKDTPKKDSRQIAKTIKEMDYIYEADFQRYIQGKETSLFDLNEFVDEQSGLYKEETTTRVQIEGDPYRVGLTYYEKDTSLAFIGTKDPLLEKLMESLQYSGIGGKRTSGVGRFAFEVEELSDEIKQNLTIDSRDRVMLLSHALPVEEEMTQAVKDATYLLTKASGFAYSEAGKDNYRKQDLYKFKAGSVFKETFMGDIYDVAPVNFPHPVWNYAKPIFLRLESEKHD